MLTRRILNSYWPDGDGSTLTLDFTTGVLDPRLTFTRSGTGTFINASGVVATASTNTPRFDYDPTSIGTPRGLLIEGSATNLLNWSESFATSGGTNNNWADTNITRNSTNNTDPANGTTALRVTASGAGNGTIISTAAIGTSAQRAFSIWLRRVSGTGDIQYTLNNGSTYTTQAITSSWVRYTFAATTADQRVGIRIVTSGDSIELWGAQLEAGSGASSYISTGASQGTRNADFCYMSGISSWFNAPTGTIISKVTYSSLTGSNAGIELSVGTGSSAANRIAIRRDYVDYYSGGGAAQAEMYPTVTSGAVQIGTAYAAGDFAMCSNGGTMRTDSSGSVPIGLDTLKLYSDGGASAGLFINGWVRSFKYFPTRLSNAQLQSLTT